jgi:hypothetical protein
LLNRDVKWLRPTCLSPPSSTIKKLKRSLHQQFESLEDPRVRQPEHLLLDIVAIAILAVISGADDMVAVETYGKAKAAWLKTFLALPNGIPSHDTFSRVLALIEPPVTAGVLLEVGAAAHRAARDQSHQH